MNNTNDAMITYLFIDYVNSIIDMMKETKDESKKADIVKFYGTTRNHVEAYLKNIVSEKFLQIFLQETKVLIK